MSDIKNTTYNSYGYVNFKWADRDRRIRRVVSRSNHRVTGKYPSWKAGRMLQWESHLERDAFILHDVDPSVQFFREQPARLTFHLQNVLHNHVPDLYVESNGNRILREIKYRNDAEKPEIEARSQHLQQVLPQYGLFYDVLLESEIRKEPRLSNAKFLMRFGRTPVDLVTHERVRRQIKSRSCVLWGDVKNDCFGPHSMAMICRLVIEGLLFFDLDQPLSHQTEVFLAQ
jgi:hypothetical protein